MEIYTLGKKSTPTSEDDSENIPHRRIIDSFVPIEQYDSCITLSTLPSSHYKQLFHLELIKQRNKPKEQTVQKPPDAPFFLQSYSKKNEEDTLLFHDVTKTKLENPTVAPKTEVTNEEWASAWSDDENSRSTQSSNELKATSAVGSNGKRRQCSDSVLSRSKLASILQSCNDSSFQPVTDFLKGMGPSSIDVAFR